MSAAFARMAGEPALLRVSRCPIRNPSADDSAYQVLLALTFRSVLLVGPLLITYGVLVVRARLRRRVQPR